MMEDVEHFIILELTLIKTGECNIYAHTCLDNTITHFAMALAMLIYFRVNVCCLMDKQM